MLQQYLFVMAVTLETPSRVTVVRQSQIILAYIVQVNTDYSSIHCAGKASSLEGNVEC